MLEMFLNDTFSITIHSTTEGKEAIEKVKSSSFVYDIIFMDVNMPVIK